MNHLPLRRIPLFLIYFHKWVIFLVITKTQFVFVAETPFEIPDIVEATTKLETYGIPANDTLGGIGEMAAVTLCVH